jgi:UDPglucose--hexose-1-phosphate uridylyltransferase
VNLERPLSELRQNLATREWVIIAPERRKGKPLQSSPNALMDTLPVCSEDCPFCPKNEDRFDNAEIEHVPHPDPGNEANSPWLVRCIENKYKIFAEHESCPVEPTEFDRDGIYSKFIGCGSHELILESPLHNQTFATMSQQQVESIIGLYLRRFNVLKENPNNLLTIIFKNHGPRSGASQIHPHTQILAMRVVPNFLRYLLDEAARFFDNNGICVFCKILKFELEDSSRIVYQNERFVSLVPYAASVAYEIHIMPRSHDALFGDMSDSEVVDFADCLQKTMKKLYVTLSNPDFNIILKNPPYRLSGVPYYHWHLQIMPHTSIPGGFEMGSRIRVNVVAPEESAEVLRKADVQ